jgi:hypothetical protein
MSREEICDWMGVGEGEKSTEKDKWSGKAIVLVNDDEVSRGFGLIDD